LQTLVRSLSAPDPSTVHIPIAASPPSDAFDRQLAAVPVSRDAWLEARRGGGRLYADPPQPTIDLLARMFPDRVTRLRDAADRICRHEFDLLGSGPCYVRDSTRPGAVPGYGPLDWSLDPIAKRRFPTGFKHADWTPRMRPGNADIKWPWEIGRCQHWVTLGQAYRFTGNERYAAEIVNEHQDFLDANPIGIGMQFLCTMDVAIRALNWVMAFELVRASPSFDGAAALRAYRSLFDHGDFIVNNLENKYEVTSNHFLSNVVGLYGVALVFRDLPQGAAWLKQCREWVEQEMRVQVLEDGADYESSVPYHRLVAELFLSAARIAQLEGTALSPGYLARLRQMTEFHFATARPDGLMPQVGDADDGRLHIFTDYGTWQPQDGRHLAGAAAAVLGDRQWMAAGGGDALWESAWWGAPIDGMAVANAQVPPPTARLFPHAGIAVSRDQGLYLLVTNARVGTAGFGNHKHNDLLSFEYHDQHTPLIIDAGSYLYTSDPDARNRFRSTAIHNTVMIDGVEQNDLRPDYLFRLFETSSVEHVRFGKESGEDVYVGRHTGYERLASKVTHEREFRLTTASGRLSITDRLRGAGRHALRWHFHLAPGVEVEAGGEGRSLLRAGGKEWSLTVPNNLAIAVSGAWYSPSFGVRVPCQALDLSLDTWLSADSTFVFTVTRDPR
jgi:hypothetical protein